MASSPPDVLQRARLHLLQLGELTLREWDLDVVFLKNIHDSRIPEITKLPSKESCNTDCLWGVEPLVAKGGRELLPLPSQSLR